MASQKYGSVRRSRFPPPSIFQLAKSLDKTRVRKFCVHVRAIGSRPAYIGERGISLSLGGGHANRVVGASSHAYCLICLTNGATQPTVTYGCAVTASSVCSLEASPLASSFPLPFRSMTSNCAAQILFSRAIYPRLSSSSRRL